MSVWSRLCPGYLCLSSSTGHHYLHKPAVSLRVNESVLCQSTDLLQSIDLASGPGLTTGHKKGTCEQRTVIRLWTSWSHEGNTVGCGLHPAHHGCGTVRKHVCLYWHTSQLASWGADLCLCYLRSQKRNLFFNKTECLAVLERTISFFLCVFLLFA